jgi:hypothetical protein
VNVSGKTVFLMLFGVALAFSVDPIAGVFAFLALAAATNRDAAARVYHALNDAAYRVERQLEQRGLLPTALVGGVTTPRINKEEDAVVTVDEQTPATAGAATTTTVPASVTTSASAVTTPHINKREASVVTLPSPSVFNPADPRPARFAVPLGRDQSGRFRWLDFGSDALHIGLYGTSGCGKDHLLRLWFVALLNERGVRWAILDGKGDWLTPNLARLPQMLLPPAGGYGDEGQQRILDAIGAINEEAKRRFGLLLSAGVRSVEEYNQTAPDPLPLLIVLATDIIDVVDETERLLIALVSKARALGIRVIVSMQTPTGKRLEWRMNLSTLISGALVDGSQDAPALGVRDPKALLYRPSQLPPPPGERGVFVVRHNNEQFLVRTPALVGDFDALINARNDAALLETLLFSAVTTPHINKREDDAVTAADPVPTLSDARGRNEGADLASASAGTGVDPSQGVSKPRDEIVPSQGFLMPGDGGGAVPRLQNAPGRVSSVPVPNRPEPAKSAEIGDFGGFSECGDGDDIAPSQGAVLPQNAPSPVPEHQQALGRAEEADRASESLGTGIDPSPTDGDDALLAALAALQRAGVSREQARALGARFRNDDWARAARLKSED